MHEKDEKQLALETTCEREPDNQEARFTLAQYCQEKERWEDSIDHYLRILKVNKKFRGDGKPVVSGLTGAFAKLGLNHPASQAGKRKMLNYL